MFYDIGRFVRKKYLTNREILKAMREGATLYQIEEDKRFILYNVLTGKRKKGRFQRKLYWMSPWEAEKHSYFVSREQVIDLLMKRKITRDPKSERHFILL